MVSQLIMEKKDLDNKNIPDVLTLKQACEVLNCHANTLRNWDNEGKLKAIRFGSRGDRRYKKSEILKLLKNS